jgi:hypothetical protein
MSILFDNGGAKPGWMERTMYRRAALPCEGSSPEAGLQPDSGGSGTAVGENISTAGRHPESAAVQPTAESGLEAVLQPLASGRCSMSGCRGAGIRASSWPVRSGERRGATAPAYCPNDTLLKYSTAVGFGT